MDANRLWQQAAEAQEAQRRAEAKGDDVLAGMWRRRVNVLTRLAEKSGNE